MKKFDLFSALLGLALGLFLAGVLPSSHHALAEEPKKVAMTQEEMNKKLDELIESQKKEMDKKLDELIESQKKVKEQIAAVLEQSQTLKVTIR